MKLVTSNLNDQVYEILKNKILTHELRPGTRLVDTQLAEEFGISRTPIRDAIRQLAEDGLIVCVGKKGYAVFQPSEKDIEEIFELREILDIAAATKLIKVILPQNMEVIKEIEDYYVNAEKYQSEAMFIKSDEAFHDALIRICGNSRIMNIYTDLRTQTRIFRRITSVSESRMKKAINYHKRIINGLKNLDLNETIDAIKSHIAHSKQDALNDFYEVIKE